MIKYLTTFLTTYQSEKTENMESKNKVKKRQKCTEIKQNIENMLP